MTDARARPPVLALDEVGLRAVAPPRGGRDVQGDDAAPGETLVQGVSLTVGPGEAVGLVGASGVGKTLLTRAALGLLPPGVELTPGSRIRIEGTEMAGAAEGAWRRVRGRVVGAVFQDPGSALTPVRTIGDQLREVLRHHRGSPSAARALLDEVELRPDDVLERAPHELSGGMRQRALLALALAPGPRLLLADEPTASLDATTEARIVDLLRRLHRSRELALLVVSHDPAVVRALCTRRVTLAAAGSGNGGNAGAYSHATRHQGETSASASTPAGADPLLEVEDLDVGYGGGGWVVRGVDLELRAGELLGLVGPSGSGKTTLIRGLLGLATRRRGTVKVGGEVVGEGRAARRDFRRRVQGVWQDALGALDPRLTVGRSLDEVLRAHRPELSGEERADQVVELLRQVGLPGEVRARRPRELSGGQRQRVGVARALALDPEVLLLDEPVSALDPEARESLLDLLGELLAKRGMAGILCAHDLGVVGRRCRRVAVMVDGRIVEQGPTERVVAEPGHPLTVAMAELARVAPGGP